MDASIKSRVIEYYTSYYRDQLGLPDWEARVASRLTEEENIAFVIKQVAQWINLELRPQQRILVVGAGTGAEFIALSRYGCNVYGIEPERRAIQIGAMKARDARLSAERLIVGKAEQLPFPADFFDLIWCWTVIEHVQNVEASIAEMIRVVKPWGHVFIQTPDYRHFYEPHYKMLLPMMAPKWLVRGWLRLARRPTSFLDTLQFVNARQLTNIFQDLPVVALQAIQSWPPSWKPGHRRDLLQSLTYWIVRHFSIQRDQYWILRKLEHPRT